MMGRTFCSKVKPATTERAFSSASIHFCDVKPSAVIAPKKAGGSEALEAEDDDEEEVGAARTVPARASQKMP